MREITCSVTGHRPDKLPWGGNEKDERCIAFKKRMSEEIMRAYEKGYRRFISGMARGVDIIFCETALELRDKLYSDIIVEAAVPCDTQADKWNGWDQARYRRALARCSTVTYVSHEHTSGCMMKRNRYLVDEAGLLLAVYGGESSGTMKTLLYAVRCGIEVVVIDPNDF